jgi:signal transduction histidine kinase
MAADGVTPAELAELRARLAEAEETLEAIRLGEVDALLIADGATERIYTLRNADAPYRFLVEQMQEGAATLNARGDIVYSNRRFAVLVEAPLEQVIGRPIDRWVDTDDLAALRAIVARGSGKLRTRLRPAAGAPVEVQISLNPFTVDEVEHRALIVTDISTLTKVQRESQSKDEFLAMLAHELRNPLGAIAAAVQVLGLSALHDRNAVRARDVIQRQTLHMARLVDDLLDVGRVMTGKIILATHPVDLAETVKACVSTGVALQHAQRVEVDVRPAWVLADPVRLDQVIGNLVSNALKFSPPGKRVRLSVRADGPDAVLRVSDEGIGMDPDLLPRIFNLFVQADDTIDRAKGGLGIGLTLVRRLVELHGGTVRAASPGLGQGATLTVTLPQTHLRPPPAPASAADTPHVGQRVLLVDDHADAREMYGLVLRAEGHIVQEAADGAAALEACRRSRPDICIVDIGLPEMDGYEVASTLRAEGFRDTLLIAISGYAEEATSKEDGFDHHLVKPVDFASLKDLIAERGGD